MACTRSGGRSNRIWQLVRRGWRSAIIERRTGPIDPQGFTFVGTGAHIVTVRRFGARLPQLLAE